MAGAAAEFVGRYLDEYDGTEPDLNRVVHQPSGLAPEQMLEAITDSRFTEPGRAPLGLQLMCDFMHPDDSLYFDAIYGANHGQSAIRNWLIPVMATIDFIEFVPTAEPVLFEDGEGQSSLDEWEMVAVFGEDRMPLSRGVSVRRYRDGWITWACDVYDTGPFRVPPPDDAPPPEVEAEPIPDWPRTVWTRDPNEADDVVGEVDFSAMADEFHPTDSEYHDPIFGVIRGREAIRTWMTDIMGKVGHLVFEPLGPELDDGSTTVQEWQQMAVQPDGTRVFMTRGTSVRRRDADGLITYACDYFDTASIIDPEVQAAGIAAGSTLTSDDIARYRT